MYHQLPVPLREDIVWKAKNIAKIFGCSERYIYHLHSNTNVPIFFCVGSTICARRSVIAAWIVAQEARLPYVAPPPPAIIGDDYPAEEEQVS